MNRKDVYKALDSERDYQDAMTASEDRPDMVENLSLGDKLLAMQHCLDQARTTWYYGLNNHQDTMEFVRKIGGLAVKAGEEHEMPQRKGFER